MFGTYDTTEISQPMENYFSCTFVNSNAYSTSYNLHLTYLYSYVSHGYLLLPVKLPVSLPIVDVRNKRKCYMLVHRQIYQYYHHI